MQFERNIACSLCLPLSLCLSVSLARWLARSRSMILRWRGGHWCDGRGALPLPAPCSRMLVATSIRVLHYLALASNFCLLRNTEQGWQWDKSLGAWFFFCFLSLSSPVRQLIAGRCRGGGLCARSAWRDVCNASAASWEMGGDCAFGCTGRAAVRRLSLSLCVSVCLSLCFSIALLFFSLFSLGGCVKDPWRNGVWVERERERWIEGGGGKGSADRRGGRSFTGRALPFETDGCARPFCAS